MSGAEGEDSGPEESESENSSPGPSSSTGSSSNKDKDGGNSTGSGGVKIIKKNDRLIKEYVDVKTGKITVYEPGIKLEVSDFKGDWYPAKVLEVDYDENEVLIHYDKWSPRFDEWIKTDSNRLRPSSDTNVVKIQFKIGERVEALWSTDGRKYPGTIKAILPNDYYEVLFDDGIKCKKKVSQIFKLHRITRGKAAAASASGTKENEKSTPSKSVKSLSRGTPTPETILYPAKSALFDLASGSVGAGGGSTGTGTGVIVTRKRRSREFSVSTPDKLQESYLDTSASDTSTSIQTEAIQQTSHSTEFSTASPGSALSTHHSIFDPVSTDLGKRKRASHDYSLFLKIPKKPQVPKSHENQGGEGGPRRRQRRSRAVIDEEAAAAAAAAEQEQLETDDNDQEYDDDESEDLNDNDNDESPVDTELLSPSSSVSGMPLKRIRKSSMKAIENIAASPAPGERSPKRRLSRRGSLIPLDCQGLTGDLLQKHPGEVIPAVLETPPVEPEPELPTGFVDDQGNLVTVEQTEGGGWICPIDKCGKQFRKDSLLQMHLKHYHPTSKIHLQTQKLNRFEITIARARGSRARAEPSSFTTTLSSSASASAEDAPVPVRRRRRDTSGTGHLSATVVAAAVTAVGSPEVPLPAQEPMDLEDMVLTVDSVEASSASKDFEVESVSIEEEEGDDGDVPAEESLVDDHGLGLSMDDSATGHGGATELDQPQTKSSKSVTNNTTTANPTKKVCVLLEKINVTKLGGSASRRTGSSSRTTTRVSQRGRILAPRKWNRIYSDTDSDDDDDLLDLTDSSDEDTTTTAKPQKGKTKVEPPVATATPSTSTSAASSKSNLSSRKSLKSKEKEKTEKKILAMKIKKVQEKLQTLQNQAQNETPQSPVDIVIEADDGDEDDNLIEDGEMIVTHLPGRVPSPGPVPPPAPTKTTKSRGQSRLATSSPTIASSALPSSSSSLQPQPGSSSSVLTGQSAGQQGHQNRRGGGGGNKLNFKLSRGSRDKNFMGGLTAKKLNLISQELIGMGAKKRLTAKPRFEDVRVDVINCECGLQEEFGLMMQCELCQAWQHGNCYEIFEVAQLPQYYVCSFCREPKKLRSSLQNEWYQEVNTTGRLPRFSSGPPNDPEQEDRMRGSNDLFNSISNIQSLLRSTQMKISMLNSRKDHPKLVLWSQEQRAPAVVARTHDFKSNFRSVLRQLLLYHCRDHAYISRLRRKVEMKVRVPNEEQCKIQDRLKNRLHSRAWQILRTEKKFRKILRKKQLQPQHHQSSLSHPPLPRPLLQQAETTATATKSEAPHHQNLNSFLNTINPSSDMSSSENSSAPVESKLLQVEVDGTPANNVQVEDDIIKIKTNLQLKSKGAKLPVLHTKSEEKHFLLLTKSKEVPSSEKPTLAPAETTTEVSGTGTTTGKGKLRRLTQTVQLPDGSYTRKILGFGRIVEGVDGVKIVQLLSSQPETSTGGTGTRTAEYIRRKRVVSETGAGTGTVTTTACVAEDQNNSSSSNNNNIVPSPSVNKKLVNVDTVSKLGLCKTCKHSLKMDWKTKEFVKEENIHLIKTVSVKNKNNKAEEQTRADEASSKIENTSNLNQIQNETDLDLSLAGLTDDLCGTEADISDLGMGLGTDNMMHIINRDHANVINDVYADGLNNIDMDGTGTDIGMMSDNNGGDLSMSMAIPTSFINGTGGEMGSLKNLCETIVGKDGENNSDKSDAASAPSVSESGAPAPDLKSNLSSSKTNNTLDELKVSEVEPTSVDVKPEIIEQPKPKRSMEIGITIPKKITGKSCRLNLHAAIVREQALLDLHLDSIENKLKELETPKLGDPRALLNKLKDLEDLKKKVQLINDKIEFMRNIRPDHSNQNDQNLNEAQLSCTDVTAAAAVAAAAASVVSTPVSVPAE